MTLLSQDKLRTLMRNETEHPPFLSSVHVSTHPNKKSKHGSRFVQSTSPETKFINETNSSNNESTLNYREEPKEEENKKPHHGVTVHRDSRETFATHLQGLSSVTRTCNIHLKTPNKAFNESLFERSHCGLVLKTKLFQDKSAEGVEEHDENSLGQIRNSYDCSTGTFSFGEAPLSSQAVSHSTQLHDSNDHSCGETGRNEGPQKHAPTLSSDIVTHPPLTSHEKINHTLHFQPGITRFTTMENLNNRLPFLQDPDTELSEKSRPHACEQTIADPAEFMGAENSKQSFILPSSCSIPCASFSQGGENPSHEEKEPRQDVMVGEEDDDNDVLLTKHIKPSIPQVSNGFWTRSERPAYTYAAQGQASLASPPNRTKNKKSKIIMCRVPATGEALLNKPTPLRVPSRRSVIPRKLPRPPTTGFLCDEPEATSRYSRYVQQMETDMKERCRKRQNCTEMCSESSTEPKEPSPVTASATLGEKPSSLWVVSVVLNISNHGDAQPSHKSRTAPMMISVYNAPKTYPITKVEPYITEQLPLQLDSSQGASLKVQNSAMRSICDTFNLPLGLQTILNPSVVGTHTCGWFWNILCSDSLWQEAKANAQSHLLKCFESSYKKVTYRDQLRYVVFLLIYVVENIENASSNYGKTLNHLQTLRHAQEHEILITVGMFRRPYMAAFPCIILYWVSQSMNAEPLLVRDTLKSWVQAAFKCLNKKWSETASLASPTLSLSHLLPDQSLVLRAIELKRDHLNTLRTAEDHLRRLMEENSSMFLDSTAQLDGLSYLDRYLQRIKSCHDAVLINNERQSDTRFYSITSHEDYDFEKLRKELLLLIQQRQRQRHILLNLLVYDRIRNWTAVLSLWTLKSLDMYVQSRRRLKGLYGTSRSSLWTSSHNGDMDLPRDPYNILNSSSRQPLSAQSLTTKRTNSIVRRSSHSAWTLDSRLSYVQRPLDGCEPTLDDIMGESVLRSSAGSCLERLSLLSYESLDDNILHYGSEESATQRLTRTPDRVWPKKPKAYKDVRRDSSALSLGSAAKGTGGYSSLRSHQRRQRRRTTLGYTLRLQKPK